jgi:hypothetical protein
MNPRSSGAMRASRKATIPFVNQTPLNAVPIHLGECGSTRISPWSRCVACAASRSRGHGRPRRDYGASRSPLVVASRWRSADGLGGTLFRGPDDALRSQCRAQYCLDHADLNFQLVFSNWNAATPAFGKPRSPGGWSTRADPRMRKINPLLYPAFLSNLCALAAKSAGHLL